MNPSISLLPPANAPATPPPEAEGGENEEQPSRPKSSDDRAQWREDVLLDFAAFESSICRIQLLLDANDKERKRYEGERERILRTQTEVRENTKLLQSQLVDAQATLALRKDYDTLAEKITLNPALKSREEQASNLQKLREEIQDLEREKEDYETTWKERREQFGKIVEQGMQLRRLIRDEKEEAERSEGLLEEAGDEEESGRASGDVTPLPLQTGSSSPNQTRRESPAPNSSQQVDGMLGVEGHARSRERSPLRNALVPKDPLIEAERKVAEEDTEMAEGGEVLAAPAPAEGLVAEAGQAPGSSSQATEATTVLKDAMDTS